MTSFPGIESTSYYNTYIVDQPITLVQGYKFVGLNDKGVPVFNDFNNDNSIGSADRTLLGNNDPITAGMTNEFSYRNFSFSFLIDYNRFNGFGKSTPANVPGFLAYNQTTKVLGRWVDAGDESFTDIPRFTRTTSTYLNRNLTASSYNYQKIDIYRLRNLSLSYNVPNQIARKVKMSRAQIYFHAQNVWVSGRNSYTLDPETGNSFTPPLQTFTFGFNCSF